MREGEGVPIRSTSDKNLLDGRPVSNDQVSTRRLDPSVSGTGTLQRLLLTLSLSRWNVPHRSMFGSLDGHRIKDGTPSSTRPLSHSDRFSSCLYSLLPARGQSEEGRRKDSGAGRALSPRDESVPGEKDGGTEVSPTAVTLV